MTGGRKIIPGSKMSTQARQVSDTLNNVSKKVLDAFYRKNTVHKVLVDQESLTTFRRFYNCNFPSSLKTKILFFVS